MRSDVPHADVGIAQYFCMRQPPFPLSATTFIFALMRSFDRGDHILPKLPDDADREQHISPACELPIPPCRENLLKRVVVGDRPVSLRTYRC